MDDKLNPKAAEIADVQGRGLGHTGNLANTLMARPTQYLFMSASVKEVRSTTDAGRASTGANETAVPLAKLAATRQVLYSRALQAFRDLHADFVPDEFAKPPALPGLPGAKSSVRPKRPAWALTSISLSVVFVITRSTCRSLGPGAVREVSRSRAGNRTSAHRHP